MQQLTIERMERDNPDSLYRAIIGDKVTEGLTFAQAILRAIARALQKKPKKAFSDAQSMMDWWLDEKPKKQIEGQIAMEEIE